MLPIHSDLVGEIRRWTKGLAGDEPLFPRLAKRKAYTMVQRDLEDARIAYETEEGFADFHAAGRHTHITELLRSGVSLVEAKELARHSDVRMTMKYTHIGLQDQARAVNLLAPLKMPAKEEAGKCLHVVCTSGGTDRQPGASDVTKRQQKRSAQKRQNPCRSKGLDAQSQPMSELGSDCQKVEAAGIERVSA